MSQIPFYNMVPHDELIVGGTGYVLAEPGKNYVVFLYDGVPTSLDLTAASGWFDAQWYDHRTGLWVDEPNVPGGGIRTFTPPTYEDWVLLLKPAP